MDEPSLSEHIDGLMGLLLMRLHMDTGRFHEGIVFGGGIFVDAEVSDEDAVVAAALPPSLIVLLREGKLSQRTRPIPVPTARRGSTGGNTRGKGERQNAELVHQEDTIVSLSTLHSDV